MIKTLKVLSEIQARSIFSFRTFPVVNPQVFPVYRTSYHTTKPAIWKERKKSGFFLHRYLNHSQLIKLDSPTTLTFVVVGLSLVASCSLDTASSPKGCDRQSRPSITTVRRFHFIFFSSWFFLFLFFPKRELRKNPWLYYLNYIALLTVECLYMKIYIY